MDDHYMRWRSLLRTLLLLLLFVSLVIVFFALQKWLLGRPFNLLFTNVGTDYLLSAIAQSEAAIIGLVITVTLVAVQLSVAAYIPRVISVFRRHVDLWLLTLIYGASMSFSLLLLNVSTPSLATRENMIILAYSTFPAAFLMLIPYISGTLRALAPYSVMKSLLEASIGVRSSFLVFWGCEKAAGSFFTSRHLAIQSCYNRR